MRKFRIERRDWRDSVVVMNVAYIPVDVIDGAARCVEGLEALGHVVGGLWGRIRERTGLSPLRPSSTL